MKHLLTSFILLLATTTRLTAAQSYEPKEESLVYRVMYKWGIINKQAGTVTVTTHSFDNDMFQSILTGQSAPWADHFYSVRDTLIGTMMTGTLEPVYYEKIAREGGDFKRDVITYDRTSEEIQGNCNRWRQRKKETEIVHSTKMLKATGTTLDMLSSFYYMRHIDYPSMQPDQSVTVNVFSGQKKETLKITYIGKERVKVEDKFYLCYYIKFSFTGDNGKKSSDDMFAWISADRHRIPMMMLGNLPIGSIRCYYVP